MKNTSGSSFINKMLSFVILVLMAANSLAQQVNDGASGADRQKTISGKYGGSSGICLFEDGRFLLYGYATIVFGSYVFEKDDLLFHPDRLDSFQLFGTQNPALGDSMQMNFVGFEERETLIQFNKDSIHRIFNADANCFDFPYIYRNATAVSSLELLAKKDEMNEAGIYQKFAYQNDGKCNDFLLIYNKPQRAREDFSANLHKDGENLVIKLSNYGGEKGFLRNNANDNQEDWREILNLKKQYESADSAQPKELFCNAQYNTFDADLQNYHFDTKTNQYVSKFAKENEGYDVNNGYQDDRYLRKYLQQVLIAQPDTTVDTEQVALSSLFFARYDIDQ